MDLMHELKQVMLDNYQIDNVIPEYRDCFETDIRKMLAVVDSNMEGYADHERQRDLSIKYAWGHHHDFGSFQVSGAMGDRHLGILAEFIQVYGLPKDLTGKKILDIGVWSGGSCMWMFVLGAEVTALEEVKKYTNTVEYLAKAFNIKGLKVNSISLYDLDIQDEFDYVIYSGVVYHVTDPVLSLRILFNALKNGGQIFIETFGLNAESELPPLALVEGPSVTRGGNKASLNRSGWNYFVPSPKGLFMWIQTVGFEDIKVGCVDSNSRIKAVATRQSHVDMLRAGLSRPEIR